jgi:hypothetical protein
MGAVAKSYMRKGFLIYEEMSKYSVICEEVVATAPFWISLYVRKFFFYQCRKPFWWYLPSVLKEPINDRLDTKMQKVFICYGKYMRKEINVIL